MGAKVEMQVCTCVPDIIGEGEGILTRGENDLFVDCLLSLLLAPVTIVR